MHKLIKNLKKEKGFTLIELMIVIAIIGILAAIAIPQFAAYRMRAFNAASLSDLKNLEKSEHTLSADWRCYGGTLDGTLATAGNATGSALRGGGTTDLPIIAGEDAGTQDHAMEIGMSLNVMMYAHTDGNFESFIGVSKHRTGNIGYAVDSDSTIFYQNGLAGSDFVDPTYVLTAGEYTSANSVNGSDFWAIAAQGTAGWLPK